MNRRRFLSATASASLALSAGCIAFDEDERLRPEETPRDGTETSDRRSASPTQTTRSDPTPDPDDPIQVALSGVAGHTVTVRVTRNDQTYVDVTESVSEDYRTIDTGISEPGTYRFDVSFADGPSSSTDVEIEHYDVGMGSNVIVELLDGEIQFLIEE